MKKYPLALTLGIALTFCSLAGASPAVKDTAAPFPEAAASDTMQPPPGMPPAGASFPGGKGGMPSMEAASADTLKAAYIIDASTASKDSVKYTSRQTDENVILVRNKGNLTLSNAELSKTGDSSSSEDSNFTGLNAVVLANNSTAAIQHVNITSAAEGSNAVFSTGKNSHITASHVKIHTTKGSSRGLDATYGGTITAKDVEITTEGAHCAALATDRGEGTVDVTQGILSTAGEGSPCIYSTGTIKVTDSKGVSTGSEIAVVEGKNSIELENTQLVGNVKHGVMLYQSFSGDAGTGTASFTAKNSQLTNLSKGPMFYITNTKAVARLENTVLDSNSDTLIQVTSDHWGQTGQNGGDFTFIAKNQSLKGDVSANAISSIALQLEDGSSWTGAFNKEHTAKTASIRLCASALWTLADTSYVTSIQDDRTDFSNIQSKGHTLYYDAASNSSLGGKTYLLPGGGKLIPTK